MKVRSRSRVVAALLVMALLVQQFATQQETATAGIYDETSATQYQEIWIPHTSYDGRLLTPDDDEYVVDDGPCQYRFPGNTSSYYVEPELNCPSALDFSLPGNATSATKAELYIDLWRGHDNRSGGVNNTLQLKLNDGPWQSFDEGADWSRTPFILPVSVSDLQNGSGNQLHVKSLSSGRKYHIDDVAVRLYGLSDSYPSGAGITNINAGGVDHDPSVPGVLDLTGGETVTVTATVSGADAVEFIAYYDGFDEDNDGEQTDWHAFNHNNCNGGTGNQKLAQQDDCEDTFGDPTPVTGTIGHMGTDLNDGDDVYSVTWDTSLIASQTGVKFKVRAVDRHGSDSEVVDALGGESAGYSLDRGSETVEYYTVPGFFNGGLCMGGGPDNCDKPTSYDVTMNLPSDISDFTQATLLNNFWLNPYITVNAGLQREGFDANTSPWTTSAIDIPVSELNAGANTISYEYNPGPGNAVYGQFIESPGPMLVVRRPNTPKITAQPQNRTAIPFQTVQFAVTATGSGLTYQWYEDGAVMGGETASSLSLTAPNTLGDTTYRVDIAAGGGTPIESDDAILSVVAAALDSDQFNSTTKAGFWTEYNKGGSDFFYTGKQLIISVPESATSLQPWKSGNQAPTLSQDAVNADMDILLGIENAPSPSAARKYQMAGVVIAGDANDFMRINLQSDESSLTLFSSYQQKIKAGQFSAAKTGEIQVPSDPGQRHLRISRTGDLWEVYTSTDGTSWGAPKLTFTQAISVTEIGPFAGNAVPGSGINAPAYSAVFDYFFASLAETASGGTDATLAPIDAGTVATVAASSAVKVDWATDEPTKGWLSWEDGENCPCQTATADLGRSFSGLVTGLPNVNTDYDVTLNAVDHNGNTRTRTIQVTTTSNGTGDTLFDVWYGESQQFGQLGNPQRWMNIVGKVIDDQGIKSLSYKIDNGSFKTLSIGPDIRRLPNEGDFNADILATSLAVGAHTITLKAVDNLDNEATHVINVLWGNTAVWEMPYAIDWAGLSSVTDNLQVVDGNWVLENDTVTLGNVDVGYDRLAVLGDKTWESYEALVPFTVESIAPDANDPASNGPGVGVMMHWNGNNDGGDPSAQPFTGFLPESGDPTPLGTIMWWRDPSNAAKPTGLQITDHQAVIRDSDTGFTLELNTEYMIRSQALMRADDSGYTYSMKVWKSAEAEPVDWSLSFDAGLVNNQPDSGSLILVSHEVKAHFGNVIVTPVGQAAAAQPSFSVAAGIIDVDDQITLSSSTPGATIYYTVDGSVPTPLSSKYTGPISLTANATVKAIAYSINMNPSAVSSAAYTVNHAPEVTTNGAVTGEVAKAVGISATVTDDGVTGSLSVLWSKASGPGSVTFSSSTSASTTATFSAVGTYVLDISANDGRLSDAATLTVVVSATPPPAVTEQGYWMLEADGELYEFGDSANFAGVPVAGKAAIAFDRSSAGNGLWILDTAGQVHVRGTAVHYGNADLAALPAGENMASISATPTGKGYWVFTDRGRVLTFGDAAHFSDLPTLGITPVGPVVASAPTPSGNGYYMLGSDGGVFAFGDANFVGSIPQVLPPGSLACPIVGLVPVPAGDGYWMVACDGGVFAFGNAPFVGSIPGVLPTGTTLNAPINGMVPYGNGYLMVASDGGVFTFSDIEFLGSLGSVPLNSPIMAITAYSLG